MNKFQLQQFDISDLLDPFFDTLKLDYPEFNDVLKDILIK